MQKATSMNTDGYVVVPGQSLTTVIGVASTPGGPTMLVPGSPLSPGLPQPVITIISNKEISIRSKKRI